MWKYDQHDWVAEAGDFVFEPSESEHSFTNLSADDNGMALVVLTGELHFRNEEGRITYIETWRTALARYRSYCSDNQVPEINLVGAHAGC